MNNCAICLNHGKMEKILCGHTFHKKCLLQLIRPYCPCCKADISYYLIENGVSKKDIETRCNVDNARILFSTIENPDDYNIYQMAMFYLSINPSKYMNFLMKMIKPYIVNISETIIDFSKNNGPGIFLYYCDIHDVIKNMICGYRYPILRWININFFKENILLKNKCYKTYNKIKNKYKNNTAVLFCFGYEHLLYFKDVIINKKTKHRKYMSLKNIHKSLSDFCLYNSDIDDINNPEKKYFVDNNYYETDNVFKYIRNDINMHIGNISNYDFFVGKLVSSCKIYDFNKKNMRKLFYKSRMKKNHTFISVKLYRKVEGFLDVKYFVLQYHVIYNKKFIIMKNDTENIENFVLSSKNPDFEQFKKYIYFDNQLL